MIASYSFILFTTAELTYGHWNYFYIEFISKPDTDLPILQILHFMYYLFWHPITLHLKMLQ